MLGRDRDVVWPQRDHCDWQVSGRQNNQKTILIDEQIFIKLNRLLEQTLTLTMVLFLAVANNYELNIGKSSSVRGITPYDSPRK